MIQKLFGSNKRKRIEDSVFGISTFYEATPYEECYWLTSVKFEQESKKIECVIYGDEITAEQRDFYLEVVNRYGDLKEDIENFINVKAKEIDIKAPKVILGKDIELATVINPQIKSGEEITWGIDYTEVVGFTTFEVGLKNWTPYWLSFSA